MGACDMRTDKTTPEPSEPTIHRSVTPVLLRRLIDRLAPTDADLDAFCINHFPEVKRRFGVSMERVAKINLLLEHVEPIELTQRLQEEQPELFLKFADHLPTGSICAWLSAPDAKPILATPTNRTLQPSLATTSVPTRLPARSVSSRLIIGCAFGSVIPAIVVAHFTGSPLVPAASSTDTDNPLPLAPMPRTRAPEQTPQFRITSQPSSARIDRSDTMQELGSTPWRGSLPNCTGTITILLALEGYIQKEVRVDCARGGSQHVRLTKIDLTP